MAHYSSSITQAVSSALYKTFGWMSAGLALTAAVSYFLWASLYAYHIAALRFAIIPLLLIQIGLTVALTAYREKLSEGTLKGCFLFYAALTGVMLSPLFIVYELSSLIGVFVVAAGMFGLTALYGMITKHDLSSLGLFLMASLFGLILLQFINLFVQSAAFDMGLAFIGVLIFAGLTAFDVQKIKSILAHMAYDREVQSKMAITGAFVLYLDFINLFLHLLRLLGKQRRD